MQDPRIIQYKKPIFVLHPWVVILIFISSQYITPNMDRTNTIFNRFCRANGIDVRINFRTKGLTFLGFDGTSEQTQEQLMQTLEFRAFVDGYEGHRHRFQDQKSDQTLIDALGRELRAAHIEPLRAFEEGEAARYSRQYDLGFAANTD